MKQFKTLIIKDFNTYKKNFYTIVIILLSLYLLSLVTSLFGYYKHTNNIHSIFFNNVSINNINLSEFDVSKASFIFNAGLTAFISFFFLIFATSLSSNALNSDYEYKCALFHRNLPINVWKISGSRYIVTIFGSFLTMLFIALFTSLISSIVMLSIFKISLKYAFLGILKILLPYFANGLLLASIGFFFSSIFKRKALGKGFISLVIIHFSIVYINFIFGIHIPYFLMNIVRTISFHVNSSSLSMIASTSAHDMFTGILRDFFSLQTLLKLSYSFVLFIISTLIFKYKEITE